MPPPVIVSGAAAAVVSSQILASYSAGPAPSTMKSDTPHSVVTTDRPRSATTSSLGTITPVEANIWQMVLAPTRSLLESTTTTSDSADAVSNCSDGESTETRCDSSDSSGSGVGPAMG